MKVDFEPEELLDSITKEELKNVVKNRLEKEYDFVLLINGKVGDGKSMLAAITNAYVSKFTGGNFDTNKIFFTTTEYRMEENKLKPKDCLDFDEGEEIFFSRRAMSADQQKMVLKFAQIRQQNYFITICAPSLFLLEKWLRGVGKESRVDCIWKIERRGVFTSYSAKTGSLQRIRINPITNDVEYPRADYYGYWKTVPKKSKFWEEYLRKKNAFLKMTKESERFIKEKRKMEELMKNSFTVREICELTGAKPWAVRRWIKYYNIFPKKYIFVDPLGRIRINAKGYEIGMKNLEKWRKKCIAPAVFSHNSPKAVKSQSVISGK